MKIIVSSDIHNDFGLIYKIIELYKNQGADYVIILGDISDYGKIKRGLIKKLVENINPDKIIFVPGNNETPEIPYTLYSLYKIKSLHGKYIIKDNIVFVGIGGADVPLFMITEDEIKKILEKVEKKFTDKYIILLTHQPPKGSLTSIDTAGSEELTKFLHRNNRAILNLHGHIHETGSLEDIINKARVINVAGTVKLFEINGKDIKVLEE
ncbi:MAG: metallophosphoesterase family protein [Nanopusillaceae archaeon]